MTTNDIWTKRLTLEKARREAVRAAMKQFDKEHYAALKALREQCGASEQGHNWKFTNVGPLGHVWFHCSSCGASRVDNPDE